MSSSIAISDQQIRKILPLFKKLLGGQEQVERYDESVAKHQQYPRNALYIEYFTLRQYLDDQRFSILWFHRAQFHCNCLLYCIGNADVVDVDGTVLDISPIDYLSNNFSPENSIDILNELHFVSQLPLDLDLVGLIVEQEKSDFETPAKRPDILVREGGTDIFIECKRTMSKDNPSEEEIREDVLDTFTSSKFRDEFFQAENRHCVLQIMLPHAIDYMSNKEMREILAESNRRALGVGDRSEYLSSVVTTYYTFQKIEEKRTVLFGPQFVETTPREAEFQLGIRSDFRESFEDMPVFDVAGIAE